MLIHCPEGHVGVDGLCVECPAGTFQQEVICTSCPVGEYQPLQGQANCEPCPAGYTTSRIGSINDSQCHIDPVIDSVSENVDHVNKDDKDPPEVTLGIIVGAVVAAVVVLITIGIISALYFKQMARRNVRKTATNGSSASLSMVRTETSMSNDPVAKTRFESKVVGLFPLDD